MAPPNAISWIWRFFNCLRREGGIGASAVCTGLLVVLLVTLAVLLVLAALVEFAVFVASALPAAVLLAFSFPDDDCVICSPRLLVDLLSHAYELCLISVVS